MGVSISMRQKFVGEGVRLLTGRCHDDHKALLQPPSPPPTPLLRMSGKWNYLCPKGGCEITTQELCVPLNPTPT